MRQQVSLQSFCCHKLGFICSTYRQMILLFCTISPQPAGEGSLMLGSKLARLVELRFIVKAYISAYTRLLLLKQVTMRKTAQAAGFTRRRNSNLSGIWTLFPSYMLTNPGLESKTHIPMLNIATSLCKWMLKIKKIFSCESSPCFCVQSE